MRRLAIVAGSVVALIAGAGAASAQDSSFALMDSGVGAGQPGWTITPALIYQGAYDDNALLVFQDAPPSDFLSLVNPSVDLRYLGRHTDFDASYDGALVLYRELNPLNSYDQHGTTNVRHLLTSHIAVWAHNGFAKVPTTELLNFIAVPFVRTGSTLDDLRTGVDVALSKFTTITGAYNFQWVSFDETQPNGVYLRGGHSHGLTFALKHQFAARTSIISSYAFEHAYVVNGGFFDVQNGDIGLEHEFTPNTSVYGAFGFSRLGVSDFGPPRFGPSYRAGVTHRIQPVSLTASYSKSFVPAFAFGGTFQNEELVGTAHAPLARRVYAAGSVAWRRNEPLDALALRLKTLWIEGHVGYALQPWVSLEAFYATDHQDVDRPGGQLGRHRLGFQIVTRKPLRVH